MNKLKTLTLVFALGLANSAHAALGQEYTCASPSEKTISLEFVRGALLLGGWDNNNALTTLQDIGAESDGSETYQAYGGCPTSASGLSCKHRELIQVTASPDLLDGHQTGQAIVSGNAYDCVKRMSVN